MAALAGLRGDAGVLGELPEQFRSGDLRRVLHLQHLLAVHDAEEVTFNL